MKKKFKIFDSDALKNIHKRVFFAITIFSIIYFGAFYKITEIMILKKSLKIKFTSQEIYKRGNIYDRNGVLLASSIKAYSVAANSKHIYDSHCNYSISKKLEKILSIPRSKISIRLINNKKFVWIKRNISPREHQDIIKLGLNSLKIEKEKHSKRIYSLANITSHVVGYTNIDSVGKAGIEKGFEEKLKKGTNVILSIDSRLQEMVNEELAKTINKFSAKSGVSIILDINSGEILSMNSYPTYNPNNRKTFLPKNLFNNAIQGNYEMGSTFKPLTIAMGLDLNKINSEMLFDVTNPIQQGKYTIKDYHPYKGKLDIKGIIVKSSNIGAAKIAKKIGKKEQKIFLEKLGFYKKLKLEIKETATPLANRNNWSLLETMTIGYGHGFAITPLHLIKAYASIMNNGYEVSPTLLLNKNNTLSKKIVKSSTSSTLKTLLRAVVIETEYTGPRIMVEGYDIGAKTGTAELIKSGKYDKKANRTSLVSVFPMSNPKYIILSMIENPQKIKEENYSITAATVLAPLVKNIIINMIKILGIPSNNLDDNDDILKANLHYNQLLKKYVIF